MDFVSALNTSGIPLEMEIIVWIEVGGAVRQEQAYHSPFLGAQAAQSDILAQARLACHSLTNRLIAEIFVMISFSKF